MLTIKFQSKKAAAATLYLCVATVTLAAEATTSGEPDWRKTMRTALENWVDTEKLISSEKTNWSVDREILQDRVAVLTNETATLRATTAGINADYDASSGKREEYVQQDEKLKTLSTALASEVDRSEKSVIAILKRVPSPIREKVRPLSQRIPEDSQNTKAGLGERLQNVVGILNEINKFARDITIASEVMSLKNGESFEASVIYLGLGQGYYVNQLGTVAGYGVADTTGWVWVEDNAIGQAVSDLIAIHRNEKTATYVTLPIHIQ